MICKNCGTQNTDGVRFCRTCGAPMEQAPAAAKPGYTPNYGAKPAAAKTGFALPQGLALIPFITAIVAAIFLFLDWYTLAIPSFGVSKSQSLFGVAFDFDAIGDAGFMYLLVIIGSLATLAVTAINIFFTVTNNPRAKTTSIACVAAGILTWILWLIGGKSVLGDIPSAYSSLVSAKMAIGFWLYVVTMAVNVGSTIYMEKK